MNTKNKIQEYLKSISPKFVLDLGCGRGRILRLLSDKNCKVVAVDKQDVQNFLPKSINFIQKDIKEFQTGSNFDLIVLSMVLHFIKNNEAVNLIENFKEKTLRGGYNFILCMSDNEEGKREGYFYPSSDELKKLYKGWKIKSEEFETNLEEHDGLPPHKHNLIIFLARRII